MWWRFEVVEQSRGKEGQLGYVWAQTRLESVSCSEKDTNPGGGSGWATYIGQEKELELPTAEVACGGGR